jgi:hypothetical protein
MKNMIFFVFTLSLAALFSGCGSTPTRGSTTAAPPPETSAVALEFTVVDYQGADMGIERPRWVLDARNKAALSRIQGLEDKEFYVYDARGGDLDLIRANTQINAFADIAMQIETAVVVEGGNNITGDPAEKDSKMQFVDRAAGIVSKAVVSGFTLDRDFWQRLKYRDNGREEIVYYAVYVIGKEDLRQQLDIAMGRIEAKTLAEQEAKESIRQAIRDAESLLD